MKEIEKHVELSPTEARGGGMGVHLLTMLIASGFAAIGVMSLFWIMASATH